MATETAGVEIRHPSAGPPPRSEEVLTPEAVDFLALLHRTFPEEGWDGVADRIGAYLATSRDEVEGHWPPIPDHWAAYGQAETAEFADRSDPPLSDDELDYAREQAGQFGMQARYLGQQRCPDCHRFCRRLGPGGACPHCDEPVTFVDLLGEEVLPPPPARP